MAALAALNPIPLFFDLNGTPLSDGRLFFGVVANNPETNPVTVYWDADATQPAAQPVHTLNGYPMRNGSPSPIFVNGDYSLTVKDRYGRQVFYGANSADFGNASTILQAVQDLRDDLADYSLDIKARTVVSGGGTGTPYSDASFLSSKLITTHAWYDFLANSVINWAGGAPIYGHASYNDNVQIVGSVNADHHKPFQARPHYNNLGTINDVSCFDGLIDTTAGSITNAAGLRFGNPLGTGAIGTLYGVVIEALSRGNENWGIFVQGPTKSFMGGPLWLGNAGNPYSYIEYNSNQGHTQVVPRPGGYAFKIGGINAAERMLRIGDPTVDTTDCTLANAGNGDMELTARTGYAVSAKSPLKLPVYTVATLPSAAAFPYCRAFVSDANAAAFNGAVVGGGANKVPVFSEGAAWKIG